MGGFTPFERTSSNIPKELLRAANERKINSKEMDFDLLGYETYYKFSADPQWTQLEKELSEQFTHEQLLSEKLEFRQEYKIRIRPFRREPTGFNLQFSLASNSAKSKVVAVIKPESDIPLLKSSIGLLKAAIQKQKLRSQLMVGIFDKELDNEIKRLMITLKKESKLTKPYKMVVCAAISPAMPVDDSIIKHYEKGDRQRSIIQGVEPGDLILEYIKPKAGQNGRSCNGAIYVAPKPECEYARNTVADETIRPEEGEESVRYYADKSGFVKQNDKGFTIANELSLKSASFKGTGSIDPGETKDIVLNIDESQHGYDAVGMGVKINVKELNVEGTIGKNTSIQARDVNIGAQTHRDAQIEVQETANIKLHRGMLKAKEATIGILEAGTVIADVVHVGQMLGGEIIAHKVYIDKLMSNAKVTASELIEIQLIAGEGNKLIIDPESIESFHEKISICKMQIESLEGESKELKAEFSEKQAKYGDDAQRIEKLRQKVSAAIKAGKQPIRADVARIKLHKQEEEKFKERVDKIEEIASQLVVLRSELENLQDADLHASVIHHGRYNGHTSITFIDTKTKQTYSIAPDGDKRNIYLSRKNDKKKIEWKNF